MPDILHPAGQVHRPLPRVGRVDRGDPRPLLGVQHGDLRERRQRVRQLLRRGRRRLPAEQEVRDRPEGVPVRARRPLAVEHLGCGVARGEPDLRRLVVGGQLAEAEVHQRGLAVLVDHHIAGGEVAVDDLAPRRGGLARVQPVQYVGQLLQRAHHLAPFGGRGEGPLGPPVPQVQPVDVVHDEDERPPGQGRRLPGPVDRRPLEVLPYADDTGPVDEPQELGLLVPLLADPVEDVGRDGRLGVEHLDDHGLGSARELDLREIEHGLPAAPDRPEQTVPVGCRVRTDVQVLTGQCPPPQRALSGHQLLGGRCARSMGIGVPVGAPLSVCLLYTSLLPARTRTRNPAR